MLVHASLFLSTFHFPELVGSRCDSDGDAAGADGVILVRQHMVMERALAVQSERLFGLSAPRSANDFTFLSLWFLTVSGSSKPLSQDWSENQIPQLLKSGEYSCWSSVILCLFAHPTSLSSPGTGIACFNEPHTSAWKEAD